MDKLMQLGYDMSRLWAKYWPDYMTGIRNTLIVAVIATLVGCIIGLICGILNTIPYTKSDAVGKRFILKLIRVIVRIYVEVFRGTPMILQAVFIYYGLPYFSGGAISFRGSTGVWMASLIVVAIISVDPGQTEGAKAIGMTHFQTMVHVILPQAFRNIIPQIGNNFIINIKDTSVMFVIGFIEFFAVHRNIVGLNLMYFPSATIEMIGYLCLTLAASILLRVLEKKMDGNDSYELVQVDALTMSAGTYNHPSKGTPFDERNPEAVKSMLREDLRRQAERDAAIREGQKAETRRSHGERNHQDGGEQ